MRFSDRPNSRSDRSGGSDSESDKSDSDTGAGSESEPEAESGSRKFDVEKATNYAKDLLAEGF